MSTRPQTHIRHVAPNLPANCSQQANRCDTFRSKTDTALPKLTPLSGREGWPKPMFSGQTVTHSSAFPFNHLKTVLTHIFDRLNSRKKILECHKIGRFAPLVSGLAREESRKTHVLSIPLRRDCQNTLIKVILNLGDNGPNNRLRERRCPTD